MALVTVDIRWYTRGWALVAPPMGSLAIPLNINSWALGVADRGPPGGTFKWDPTQMVDDGNAPVAPLAALPAPAPERKDDVINMVAVHHTVIAKMGTLPADFLPPAKIREVVSRLDRKLFVSAFGVDPCALIAGDLSIAEEVAAKAGAELADVLWGALEVCKHDGVTLTQGHLVDKAAA